MSVFDYQALIKGIPLRCSIRKYRGRPSEAQRLELQTRAEALSQDGVRVVLGENPEVFSSAVKGAQTYAAFITSGSKLQLGYWGEALILHCAQMGLGTCWLGASFKRAPLKPLLNQGESLVCVTPIGIPDEPYAARPRKSIPQVARLDSAAFDALPAWQRSALHAARLAPSAMNLQPWRFEVSDKAITLHYRWNPTGFHLLDCGIAMLHLEAGAMQENVSGVWRHDAACSVFTKRP